ncbi:reverse transcriptase domain-containing protein [Tanacetum coccineum]
MKAITTRSGVAYEGPSIPTNPSPKETLPKTTPILESNIPKSLPKPNIPYPSRRDDQKSRDKASNQMEKIFQIFQDLRFDISFADALLLMPRFAPTIKSLLMNKEKLLELAKIPLNKNCSAMLLKKLLEKLGDPGKFLIPYFVVVDFEADPRVPLILGRSFLMTDRALIDVYGEEITLRVDNEAVTFNLDQTTRYSSTNDKSVNRIDIIDAVCEEYAPEFLGFPNSLGGNPTPTSDPFTSEFILEEIEAYLKDDSISPKIDHADCDPKEDICLIEKLLNNDPFQLPPMDLKQKYAFLEENDKLPVIIANGLKNDEKDALLKDFQGISKNTIDPQDQEKTTFTCPYGTFAYRRMPFGLCNAPFSTVYDGHIPRYDRKEEGIVLGHKISKSGIEVDRAKFDVIAKLPHLTTVKGTEAPILVVPNWNLPFELMCDASDFAIGAVLGQRKMKHFQPIHYASKTMIEAQIHYTTTEKEMLAVVYAFEKF